MKKGCGSKVIELDENVIVELQNDRRYLVSGRVTYWWDGTYGSDADGNRGVFMDGFDDHQIDSVVDEETKEKVDVDLLSNDDVKRIYDKIECQCEVDGIRDGDEAERWAYWEQRWEDERDLREMNP